MDAWSIINSPQRKRRSTQDSDDTCGGIKHWSRGVSRLLFVLSGALTFWNVANADEWVRIYSTAALDFASAAQATADGGYVVAGATNVFNFGDIGAWVLKLDASGNVTWQRVYDSMGGAFATSVQQTADGGYIVAGYTNVFELVGRDAWVLKLDANGNIMWQKTYGGTRDDHANSLRPTPDGGYIVAGYTESFGAGTGDAWILKLDAGGDVVWQKTYGGAAQDEANSVQPTRDGGYIVAGYTNSFGAGGRDAWVLKLDASGNIVWQKAYGGTGDDNAVSVRPTPDGGYVVAGYMPTSGPLDFDPWVLKLDRNGSVIWQRTYHAEWGGYATAVQPTADGGFIVAADLNSANGVRDLDAWLLKLDASGNIVWQKTYGGYSTDAATSVEVTPDGGYVVAGYTGSFGAFASHSAWVLKLDAQGNTPCANTGPSIASTVNSSAITAGSAATVSATNADVRSASSSQDTPQESTATARQLCFLAALPTTAVPTLSEWAMIVMMCLVGLGGVMMMRHPGPPR